MNITRQKRICSSLLLGSAVLAMAGCPGGGFVEWPPADENRAWGGDIAFNDVNMPPVLQVVSTALNYACRRFPAIKNAEPGDGPVEPFAMNLPKGTRYSTALEIGKKVSPMAAPLTEETKSRPIYHIARVEVRGTDATVQVMVPRIGIADSAGVPVYQGVTIIMRGFLGNWEVKAHSSFPVGVLDVPPLTILETPDLGTGPRPGGD